jgi:adenylate cyclase
MVDRQLPAADREFASSAARVFAAEASSPAIASAFEQALTGEIAASERTRMRVLATVLAALLISDQLLFLVARDVLQSFAAKPLPLWLPLRVVGPFLAYEIVALLVLRYRFARGRGVPTPVRFVNAVIETSLPTMILWWVSDYASPAIAFGTWPSMLYFVFIIASTLRLNFVLPVFTSAVAAAGYMVLAVAVLPGAAVGAYPLLAPRYHLVKAACMLVSGLVAGAVALQLRSKFRHAVEEAASRERVTNLFGQHVSPAVVDRLLESPAEFAGEIREICVMFLDIRNFTANARERRPEAVVAYLNAAFAFMIDAVDRHGGFINKFLGDGFMAIFGAPHRDPDAAHHAVAAARDILGEIDRRAVSDDGWPLQIGIGLHVGPAVIGNVGSPRRKEFTAIGDTVNLAARLEQLTKERGSRLIASDAVIAALGDAADAPRPLGDAEVKGYAAPLRIWALDGQK